tara:strand:+ start:4505 stop:5044 length:540 start_codon:yes stop_codon:yes gene_type:complete
MKVLRNFMDEVKILQSGSYYMTPFYEHHISEIYSILHSETERELINLGYPTIFEALCDLQKDSEVYVVRDKNWNIMMASGVFFSEEPPQLFALFTKHITTNFKGLARGSKLLMSFLDQSYDDLSMQIAEEYVSMLNWAVWLGFHPVGFSDWKNIRYVDFVRCNPTKNCVSDKTSRPVIH